MRIRLIYLVLLAVLSGFTHVFGQERTVRQGELLVQLKSKQALQTILEKYEPYGLQEIGMVSSRFNIYLLKFDVQRNSQQSLLHRIDAEAVTLNTQFNHRLVLREMASDDTIPDDPYFDVLWALKNNGQNGGVEDADIDATNAWTITQGGLTALGDTIVIAIVDGGTAPEHEDLDFKKNYDEIPYNNIDDDHNGYVDDVLGWNAYSNNGSIPVHNHGAHVAGIAGATGNNGIGVTGVNWNVKILPVAGSSTSEATVIKALSYLYVMRERYDTTNGEMGAFIVAQNNSFGVDQGNPADFSVWEAMYDSLGQLGVMSVAATANAPWDIDEVGDVPTAFSTDYMIAVTNTTRVDQLYGSAGWGDTTIDLGAPGTNIYSTIIANGYGYKTGTSMATPQVTGTVALMMAAADSTFIADYKVNPSEKILMIKDYILRSVDTLPTLLGKTVSNGRLNVYKAIQLLLNRPILTADPDSVGVLMEPSSTHEEELTLSNTGNDTLAYKLSVPDSVTWLTLSNDTGILIPGSSNLVVVNFDNHGMDTGFYYTEIHAVTDEAGSKLIPVSMVISTAISTPEIKQNFLHVLAAPVPFRDHVKISFYLKETAPVTLEIFDTNGKIIYKKQKKFQHGTSYFIWKTNTHKNGIYFYQLISNQRVMKGKLVKIN